MRVEVRTHNVVGSVTVFSISALVLSLTVLCIGSISNALFLQPCATTEKTSETGTGK